MLGIFKKKKKEKSIDELYKEYANRPKLGSKESVRQYLIDANKDMDKRSHDRFMEILELWDKDEHEFECKPISDAEAERLLAEHKELCDKCVKDYTEENWRAKTEKSLSNLHIFVSHDIYRLSVVPDEEKMRLGVEVLFGKLNYYTRAWDLEHADLFL